VTIAGGVVQSSSLGGGESSAGIKEDRANGSGDKPVKKDSAAGNLEAGRPKQSKPSRRTTSLLNLFMPNSQGMSVVDVSFYRAGIFWYIYNSSHFCVQHLFEWARTVLVRFKGQIFCFHRTGFDFFLRLVFVISWFCEKHVFYVLWEHPSKKSKTEVDFACWKRADPCEFCFCALLLTFWAYTLVLISHKFSIIQAHTNLWSVVSQALYLLLSNVPLVLFKMWQITTNLKRVVQKPCCTNHLNSGCWFVTRWHGRTSLLRRGLELSCDCRSERSRWDHIGAHQPHWAQ